MAAEKYLKKGSILAIQPVSPLSGVKDNIQEISCKFQVTLSKFNEDVVSSEKRGVLAPFENKL